MFCRSSLSDVAISVIEKKFYPLGRTLKMHEILQLNLVTLKRIWHPYKTPMCHLRSSFVDRVSFILFNPTKINTSFINVSIYFSHPLTPLPFSFFFLHTHLTSRVHIRDWNSILYGEGDWDVLSQFFVYISTYITVVFHYHSVNDEQTLIRSRERD